MGTVGIVAPRDSVHHSNLFADTDTVPNQESKKQWSRQRRTSSLSSCAHVGDPWSNGVYQWIRGLALAHHGWWREFSSSQCVYYYYLQTHDHCHCRSRNATTTTTAQQQQQHWCAAAGKCSIEQWEPQRNRRRCSCANTHQLTLDHDAHGNFYPLSNN
jgi:hypothetical protein